MGHDPIARHTLTGMDGPHPSGPDVPVGEVRQIEHVASPIFALDDHARALRVDRDHLGGVPVVPLGTVVIAGELEAFPSAKPLSDVGRRFGMVSGPAGGVPVVGAALVGAKRKAPE